MADTVAFILLAVIMYTPLGMACAVCEAPAL